MLVSLQWLQSYVDLSDLRPEQVGDKLTSLGLEVEGMEFVPPIDPKVVVGKILTAVPHPNADSLQVCTVDTGAEEPLTIVCGAKNARPGITVATATVGATLPGDFKIKASKIRGEKSAGMLCAEEELGVGAASDGIVELDTSLAAGSPIADVYDVSDCIFEIGLTPDRADCLGHIGIARDLSAALARPLDVPFPKPVRSQELQSETFVKVEIEESEDCQRFCALYIDNLSTQASPSWMQARLSAAGMRPRNVVVDVTNYAMLEWGQPIHAYDFPRVKGGLLKVRSAKEGEKLTTLDNEERTLTSGDLLICDAEGPIGLAGVMGGANSENRDDSKTTIIEVAEFRASAVRKTAKRLGLHSEASHRFERGVDAERSATVALRVAELLQKCASEGGYEVPKVASTVVDTAPNFQGERKVALRLDLARRMLAMPNLAQQTCSDHLQRLGMELLDQKDDRLLFSVPSWRHDIEREMDLIEEIARLVGYDKIPYQIPRMSIEPAPEDRFIEFEDRISTLFAGQGFLETISYAFSAEKDYENMGLTPEHSLYPQMKLANPLSEDLKVMRTSLVASLVDKVRLNRNKGRKGTRLFESGRCFFNNEHPLFCESQGRHLSMKAKDEPGRPLERSKIAAIIDSPLQSQHWSRPKESGQELFFALQQALVQCLGQYGLGGLSFERAKAEELPFLHPGASAIVKSGDRTLGWLGELHPKVAKQWELDHLNPPAVLEIDLENVFAEQEKEVSYETEAWPFPPIQRDIALSVSQNTSHSEFSETISKFKKRKYLRDCELFDVYQGDHVGAGLKSMAFRLTFQSSKKTLTDGEVDKELSRLTQWLEQELRAQQR